MMTEQLMEKITGGRAVCAVVGLGYVGLPLAVNLAKAGYQAVSYTHLTLPTNSRV